MSTSSEKRLLEAARKCDGETIEEIVTAGKTKLDAVDQIGCTAVHLCAKSANLSSLSLLLEKGAKTDIYDESGMCALHHAATKDYVETMALLISYGADVNKPNKNDKLTPLHYAANNKHKRAVEFLLFCGADFTLKDTRGNEAIPEMNAATRLEYRFIQAGFKKGQIRFGGKMLKPQNKYKFTTIDLTITNNDSCSRSVCFFCRRVLLDYARNTLKDGEEIISDVFQYLVNQSSDSICVTIPGYDVEDQYDEAVMKDNIGNEYTCSRLLNDSQSIRYTATITLAADGENQGYFMVVAKGKEDHFIATGRPQVMQSKTEERFRLEIPDRSLPANTLVVLKVLPTSHQINSQTTKDIQSASSFCEVVLLSKQRRRITTELPLPDNLASGSDIIVCHAEENQTSETSWNMIDFLREEGGHHVTITEPSIGRGTAIVLEVPMKREGDYLMRIRRFLSWLYNLITKRIKPCVFSVLTKSSDGIKFRVLVIVAEEKTINKSIEKLKEENFQTQITQKSQTVMVKPSDNFVLKLEGTGLKIRGENLFRITVQSKRINQHEFLVDSKEYDFVQLFVFKIKPDQILDPRSMQREKSLVQLNIELRMESTKDVHPSYKDFPDSAFLCELASEIGEEWFLLGICLGLGPSFLETIQRENSPVRTNQTMLYSWRADNDSLPDLGVSTLMQALGKTGRNDLVLKLNRQITKIMVQKPKERISLWAKRLLPGLDEVDSSSMMDESVTDFKSLLPEEMVPEPSSDLFLVKVSQIIGPKFDIVPMLGIRKESVEQMKESISPETVMLKCLLQCRRKHGDDPIKFLDELLEALTVTKNSLAVTEIMKLFNQWLKTSAHDKWKNMKPSSINAFCEKFQHM